MKKFYKYIYKLEKMGSVFLVVFIFSVAWVLWNNNFNDISKAELFGNPPVDLNNVKYFSWSGITGWISMTCDNDSCLSSNYGVHVIMDGDLSSNGGPFDSSLYDKGAIVGNMWSDSLGWVSFDKSKTGTPTNDLYPTKSYIAKADFSSGPPYNINGWAKVLSATGEDGWDGWLSFSCSTEGVCGNVNYQTAIESSGSFSGFGWGGIALGWVDFSSVYLESSTPTITPSNEYFTALCSDNRLPTFEFIYDSSNKYDMASYTIELRKASDNSLVSTINNSITRSPGSTISHTYNPSFDGPTLERVAYNWSVKVTDIFGNSSVMTERLGSPDFTIESTKRPVVDFTWNPSVIVPDSEIFFTSTNIAKCYDYIGGNDVSRDCSSANGDLFSWSMPADATYITGDASFADVSVKFSTSGQKNISLSITDQNSGTCSSSDNASAQINTNPLLIDKPIPVFEEKRP